MVTVRKKQSIGSQQAPDIKHWVDYLTSLTPLENKDQLISAAEMSQVVADHNSQSPYSWSETANSFTIGLEMTEILAELHLDIEALIAAVLYRAVREEKLKVEDIQSEFGDTVGHLIRGVLRMATVGESLPSSFEVVLGQSENQLHNIRNMLVAMVDDVRIVLIKLAERTCAIREVKDASTEKKRKVAQEVFEIYAPLAHRLGIGHIKWELEDLSFRYLHPTAYKNIAKQLDEKRLEREDYIKKVEEQLLAALGKARIKAEVRGRVKHIYSIWRKMQCKKVDFYQIYDIRAVRVLVPHISDCYATLGVIHSMWQHIPKEFDDYITSPKENGYRSLHTAVIGPNSRILEVQIRTHEMHDEAELGVCAHWQYKEGRSKNGSRNYDDKLVWLRQIMDFSEDPDTLEAKELMRDFQFAQEDKRVYVFTPDGHVVDLAEGATPLDFAYHIHTEVGNRCRGAKANGRMIPLNYELATGEQVEILTAKSSTPSRDWLNSDLGYLKTHRARAKVRHWFKQQDREQNIADGRTMLVHEFQRLAIRDVAWDQLAEKLNLKTEEDIYAAVGAGDIRMVQILNALQTSEDFAITTPLTSTLRREEPAADKVSDDLQIDGVDQVLMQIAGCCQPVPGDEILGYITLGRGVSIHRRDCTELLKLQDQNTQRIIPVHWRDKIERLYPVDVLIKSYDRAGLLRDITAILANEQINVLQANTNSDRTNFTAEIRIKLQIQNLQMLGRVLAKMNQLPNVLEVRRV